MLIVCQNCATSYQVEPSSLGPTGRSVRCVRCQKVWFASRTTALSAIAQGHRADVAAFTAARSVAEVADPPPQPPAPPPPEPPAPPVAEAIVAEPPPPPPVAAEADPAPSEDNYGWNVSTHMAAPAASADAPPDEPLPPQEPVPSTDAPALAPMDQADTVLPADPAPAGEDIETVAARRARRQAARRRSWPLPGLSTAILALIAVNIALIGWRADVVRWLPQTASFYAAIGLPVNLRGLVFTSVTTEKENQDGVQVLVVEGMITSAAKRVVEVPRLRFAVRNESGHEIYTWTALPAKSTLVPGETLVFRSRLASPPREGQDVLVRFFNRRDRVAGNQ